MGERYTAEWFESLRRIAQQKLRERLHLAVRDIELGRVDCYYRREMGDVRVATPHGTYYVMVDENEVNP